MAASSHRIQVSDESAVGAARRAAADLAREFGGDDEYAGRVAIVASEAAHNVVRHGGGGEIILRKLHPCEGSGLDLLALDRGPGMRHVAECLRDGFSSGGTAGQGLGAIRRQTEGFDLLSLPDRGTALWCRLLRSVGTCAEGGLALGAVNMALAGEEVCGDAWEILAQDGGFRLMLADGLGHGSFAADAAREALTVFRRESARSLASILESTHESLRATRGAAISLVELQLRTGQALACGVGNVAMRLVQEGGSRHLISHRGTVGANMRPPQEYAVPCAPGGMLVLHSDGLSTQWNLGEYPGLLSRHPGLIAGVLYRDFRRERDDATVVAFRAGSS